MSNFSIFSLRVKKNCFGSGQKVPGSKLGRPLIYCGSKVSLGRVGSGPISRVEAPPKVTLDPGLPDHEKIP